MELGQDEVLGRSSGEFGFESSSVFRSGRQIPHTQENKFGLRSSAQKGECCTSPDLNSDHWRLPSGNPALACSPGCG